MRKRLVYSVLLVILLAALATGVVYAQTYYFSVDREIVDLAINADGTATLVYTYDFTNSAMASPIDYVDIGLPNGNYDLNSVTGFVNGTQIYDITKTDPQYLQGGDSGVTLGLGTRAIQPGKSGTVQATIPNIEKILYPGTDSSHPDYASFQFTPNWFGAEYVGGSTDFTLTIHLPPGVQSTESIYYTPSGAWPGPYEPESGFDQNGNIYYTWHRANGSASSSYVFGGGFPAKYVPSSAIVTTPPINFEDLICNLLCGLSVVGVIALIVWSKKSEAQRKLAYMPPKISIEGHGIKRGLTAVESAILMSQPLDKVMTMILFGVIKKGCATVIEREPLKLQLNKPYPPDLYGYETDFLAAFDAKTEHQRQDGLQNVTINLVKSVTEKMRGFSRQETIDYYQSIIKQAWAQVEAADTPEVKSEKYDRNLEWTMMDKDFDNRTQEVFRTGPVIVPSWWSHYDPVYRHGAGTFAQPATSTSVPSSGTSASLPHLPGSDFAASMVKGVQSFGAGAVGELTSFTSAVTNKTNPVPKPTYTTRSGGGGGGHSCACACACAGCACACAGGGR